MHPDDTVIDICGRKIGGGNFQVIAGPCSIETKEQITEVAEDVKRPALLFSAAVLSSRELPRTHSRDFMSTVLIFSSRQKPQVSRSSQRS